MSDSLEATTSSVTRGKSTKDFEILIIFGGFWSSKSEWRFNSISVSQTEQMTSQGLPLRRTCTVLRGDWSAAGRAVDYSKKALSNSSSPSLSLHPSSNGLKHWKWWKRHFLSKVRIRLSKKRKKLENTKKIRHIKKLEKQKMQREINRWSPRE